jgi:rRNA maturation endonuclease Nob1
MGNKTNSKGNGGFTRLSYRGVCVSCRRRFVGKGDRCQDCAQRLRDRKRRKPR